MWTLVRAFCATTSAELDEQLRPVGMVVTLDAIFNRVIRNWRQGKRTWILADEFYILFRYSFSAEFFYRLFKRMRKYNAFITAVSSERGRDPALGTPPASCWQTASCW